MRYNIINTGSTGNCIILEDIFMLDCGVPYSKIKNVINKIKVIFISHVLCPRRPFKSKHN